MNNPTTVQQAGTQPVQVHRASLAADVHQDLERARSLARMLDSQFEVAGVKVGWDSILGLLPVVGDFVSAALALYPLRIAQKHQLGKTVQARMAVNVAADWAIGLVPLVGDLFDVGFKANLRNLKLLEKALAKGKGGAGIKPPPE